MKTAVFILLVIVVAAGVMLYTFVFKGEPPPEYDQYSPGDFFVTNVKIQQIVENIRCA